MPEPQLFEAPVDLTTVSDSDLTALETQGTEEFDRINSEGADVTTESLAYSERIADDLDRVRAELQVRARRAELAQQQSRVESERRSAALRQRVHGTPETDAAPESAAVTAGAGQVDLGALSEATARGVVTALFGDDVNALETVKRRSRASLSATRREAPAVPDNTVRDAVTASVDIPGVAAGQSLPTIADLGRAFQSKAKAIPITRNGQGASRHLVASVKNRFDHTIDERTNPAQVEELWHSLVTESQRGGSAEALVAAGGWCAPSQISYDFFNISGMPRTIDLPTVGVSRGGIRFPVSPAIGDVFFQSAGSNPASGMGGFAFAFGNGTDPWLWTETDDILTVTGSVNKPTLRVPCPTFSETRLECYGISLTAGNLTDDAYPEATQNFIRLLRAAYAHAINARLISLMVAASTGGPITIGTGAHGAVPQLPNIVALAATDYRNRYAMDEDAVLEVVLPYWSLEMMRSDLGYRPGASDTTLMSVVDATITSLFTSRNVRPQFVSDWQVRGSGANALGSATAQTGWPTTTDFMIYAAGTFLHGTGLQLDLGVIRDSVLNAENDFTALWAEECHLVAKVGHESRIYRADVGVVGAVGAGVTAEKV